MRSLRGARLGAALILALLWLPGCQTGPFSTSGPAPGEIAAQAADVPSDLRPCPISGPVERYLADLKPRSHDAYQAAEDAWNQLKAEGVKSGAVAVFGATPASCLAKPGAGPGRNLVNLVAVFPDEHAATSAYQRGIFGFPTPPGEEQLPGLAKGVATGLSENAWAVQRDVGGRTLYVAWWQDRAVVSFLVAADLDRTESRRVAEAVERRIR
jgi:hypothetical protein